MPQHLPSLDIVVPCFRPPEGWAAQMAEKFRALQQELSGVEMGLILVNDGSGDAIDPKDVAWLQAEIPELNYLTYDKNGGKGHALRFGVERANREVQVFTDVDFPYRIDSIIKVYQELGAGADVALGYREPDYYLKVPPFRKALSKALRWVLKRVLRLAITDTQCGLKGFNKKGKEIFIKTRIKRFLFDLEFVQLLSRKPELVVRPVSVDLREDVTFSRMNLRVLLREFLNFAVLFFRR